MNDQPDFDAAAVAPDAAPDTFVAVVFSCRRQWNELQATEHADVRFCRDCSQSVMQARTPEGLMRAAAARECVYVEASDSSGPFLGEMKLINYQVDGPLTWED